MRTTIIVVVGRAVIVVVLFIISYPLRLDISLAVALVVVIAGVIYALG
jgi:hypothetical protein